ncbi:MAG: hypothetical protein KF905_08265 [Flavobacteriales bacterium]|nr:hypothetical protein [Flavobacteriales bacterium]
MKLFPVLALTILPAAMAMGQYGYPTSWQYSDLLKLDEPCVVVWETKLNKRSRPTGDSTMAWCFCFDKEARRLDAAVGWPMERIGERTEVWEFGEVHLLFNEQGAVEHGWHRFRWAHSNSDTMSTMNYYRTEFSISGEEVRKVYAYSMGPESIFRRKPPFGDSLNWSIDSVQVFGPNIHKRTSTRFEPGKASTKDSALIWLAKPSLLPLREVYFTNGRVGWTNTRTFQNDKMTQRADSSFVESTNDSLIGFPMGVSRYIYEGDLLIEENHEYWDEEEHPGTPLRFAIRYSYKNGVLRKVDQRDERGRRVHQPSFDYVGDETDPDPRWKEKVVARTTTGLPLITHRGFRPRVQYRYQYSATRPAWLPDLDSLDSLRTWEPR